MFFREAKQEDIPQIQVVRNAVKENVLSNPALVTDKDCDEYIHRRGKGWVCIIDEEIVGFSIIDLVDHNVWALFVHPEHDRKGIGRSLHDWMMDWYFTQTSSPAWLGTSPATRAELFYRKAGWVEVGTHGKGEVKFEMTKSRWEQRKNNNFFTG